MACKTLPSPGASRTTKSSSTASPVSVFISADHIQLAALNGFQHIKGAQQFATIIAGEAEGAALAFRRDGDGEAAASLQTRGDIGLLRDAQGIDLELRLKSRDFLAMRQQHAIKARFKPCGSTFLNGLLWCHMRIECGRHIQH
jgi:hypothetical protein